MTLRPATLLHAFDLAIVRCASLLVPGGQRGEWRREWRSELWHVRRSCTPSHGIFWSGEHEVATFCLGAFQDALCLREQIGRRPIPLAATTGSAARCILLLAGLVAASYGAAVLLPGVSLARHGSHYRDARNLVLIQDAAHSGYSAPTISFAEYSFWKRRAQDVFDGFAFYRVIPEFLPGASRTQAAGKIAYASSNLFDLLGLPIRFASAAGEVGGDLPRLILSDETWRREFGGDVHVSGRVVHLGEVAAVVSGVAPAGSWRLPGKVDGWLLEPGPGSASGVGYVVAHLKATAPHGEWGDGWLITAPRPDGSLSDFACMPLTERTRGPQDTFLIALFLACLALPATTSIPLGEYRGSSLKLTWSTRLRRWEFLGCKMALVLSMAYFVSLDMAHLRRVFDPLVSENVQLVSAFLLCLFGLRWVFRDQRQRCPMCLKRLTHPARVGQPSWNFLAWNGTELICVSGHGLLHIPETETSWFDTQRWLYLDPSWDVLFADPGLVSASYF